MGACNGQDVESKAEVLSNEARLTSPDDQSAKFLLVQGKDHSCVC